MADSGVRSKTSRSPSSRSDSQDKSPGFRTYPSKTTIFGMLGNDSLVRGSRKIVLTGARLKWRHAPVVHSVMVNCGHRIHTQRRTRERAGFISKELRGLPQTNRREPDANS